MKIYQINATITTTLSVRLPHLLTQRTLAPPLSGRLSVISGIDKGCPDQNTLYTKVIQKGSPNTNTIPTPSPHSSNIPNIEPPPSRLSVR